jgi:hypothetical protein
VLGYIPGCTSGYRIPLAKVAELAPALLGTPQHPAGVTVDRAQPDGAERGATPRYPALVTTLHVLHERPAVTGVRS